PYPSRVLPERLGIQTCLTKYGDGWAKSKAAWALNGKGDMQKLRSSLEAHKSALELALDMLTLSATKDIKADIAEIRHDTAAIKGDTFQILEEIARLQERLPATAAAPNDYILQSDRASSKVLSFIDEGEESSHAPSQSDLSLRNSNNEKRVEVKQGSHPTSTHGEAISGNADRLSLPYDNPCDNLIKPPVFQRLPEPGGDSIKAGQASAVEALSRLDVTFESLQPDSKPTPKLRKIRTRSWLPQTPRYLGHSDATEENQTSTSLPGLGNSIQEVITDRSSSTDDESSNSPDLLPERPQEGKPTVQLKDMSPESLYTAAYGIHIFINNYVLELPVPEAVLKAIPRTNHKEYTHTRFTFVTCSPYLMAGNRYSPRPTFYTSKPVTKFILAVEMNFVTEIHIKDIWKLIHDGIAYAERKLGPDTWRQSRFLKKIGAIQNFNIPPQHVIKTQVFDVPLTQETTEVAGRKVQGTMQEYTVQLRADMDSTRNSASDLIQADLPIQTVVRKITNGDNKYDHFSHWTKAIQKILDATCIIHMGYSNVHSYDDYKFLYRAWVATKPLKVTTKDGIEFVRFDDLVKQTRTFKERFLG
ncbi:unnamed protein product, partial [Fusarium equiseti]